MSFCSRLPIVALLLAAGCEPDKTVSPPVLRSVTVIKAGNGTGLVTSSPIGITCGASCTGTLDGRVQLRLTATPSSGSIFVAWTGQCTGTTSPCTIAAGGEDVTVTARFELEGAPGGGGRQ